MLCSNCGCKAVQSYTTDVTERNGNIIIVKNVPCYKCIECNEVMYTGDVVKKLEEIVAAASRLMTEISVIDYPKAA